ncbi:MAG: ligJ [Actinoallomurus sp.]|nr:ligJ [Actinoallomurus sp.]
MRGADPATGIDWDDTRRHVEAVTLDDDGRQAVYELSARRVYQRLDVLLARR